jgi:hypothetical protein
LDQVDGTHDALQRERTPESVFGSIVAGGR